MTDPSRVQLIRVGVLQPALLMELADMLEHGLRRPVTVAHVQIEPTPAFDPKRQQYLATSLLNMVLDLPREQGEKRIGITHVDLFLPVFTHLFGYAQLGGTAGVVSLYRLRPEYSGDPPSPSLTVERLHKELLHELGHTFGLVHCLAPWCAMHPSRLPEEVDLKDAAYCTTCHRAVMEGA